MKKIAYIGCGNTAIFFMRFFLLLFLFIIFACSEKQQKHTIRRGFYHWKTTYDPSGLEKKALDSLKIEQLYVHFFDVDWDSKTQKPVPKAAVQFKQKTTLPIVPTVFITNKTLQHLGQNELNALARNILSKVHSICDENELVFDEIQLDCDWSGSTKQSYFYFLKQLKKQLPANCQLSATIRLHQLKFSEVTGIPPVDKGLLMCYNVDDWKDETTTNSIFDPKVVEQYLTDFTGYALPLDIAVPIFSQIIVYRNHRFLTFFRNLDKQIFESSFFLKKSPKQNIYVAQRDSLMNGFSIRNGDVFRLEMPDWEGQQTISERLLKQIPTDTVNFILYHLDKPLIERISHEKLEKSFPKSR